MSDIENKVNLSFNGSLSNLAGYDYGVATYKDQAENKLDISRDFMIVFPDHIEGVASSFVQGFFSVIVGEIGLLSTENRLIIKAKNKELENSIKKKLE